MCVNVLYEKKTVCIQVSLLIGGVCDDSTTIGVKHVNI